MPGDDVLRDHASSLCCRRDTVITVLASRLSPDAMIEPMPGRRCSAAAGEMGQGATPVAHYRPDPGSGQDGLMRTGAARGDHGHRPGGRRRGPGRLLDPLSVLLVWAAAALGAMPAHGSCADYVVPGGRFGRVEDAARRARRPRCCCPPISCRGTSTRCRSSGVGVAGRAGRRGAP